MVRDHAFPLVYVLLTGEAEVLYRKVLDVLKRKRRDFQIHVPDPTTIISDFELAIINASVALFPAADMRLCFFHLGQSVYRHVQVQELGLQVAYNDLEDRTIKTAVHMMLSRAFVSHTGGRPGSV